MEIKLIEISGFASALQALRLPFGKEVRSSLDFLSFEWYKYNDCDDINMSYFVDGDICSKDLSLLSTLVKRGDEHSKVVRGINVYLEITAPRFWWVEMDTYSVGTTRLSSESTMHIQGRAMSENELVKMKSELVEGTEQKRIQMFSYQTLRRIYFQRKEHRLPHWRKFCAFIETLPLAQELITIKN